MSEVFRGKIIKPAGDHRNNFELIDDGLVAVENGTVVFSGPIEQIPSDRKAQFIRGETSTQTQNVIMPPTVNCHDHSFQPPAIPGELIVDDGDGGLTGWLPETLRRGEFVAKQDPYGAGARMVRAKLIEFAQSGTGWTVQYTTSSAEAVEVVLGESRKVGIKTRAGYVAMDQSIDPFCPGLQTSAAEAVRNTRLVLCKHGRKNIVVIDRFPIAVCSDTRRQLASLAREFGVLYETHADESVNEKAVHEKIYGTKSIIGTLLKDGVFMPGSVVGLAHAIHTSDEELELIAKEISRGCKVFIRACPNSNDQLGSHWSGDTYHRFRLREWEQTGAIITLGTDQGAGSNWSIFAEMLDERRRHPARLKPSYTDLLRYGTLSGYTSLGVDPHRGFEIDSPAEFIVVQMTGADGYDGDLETIAARTVHGGARTENILASYVEGRKVK